MLDALVRDEGLMTDKQYFGVWKSAYLLTEGKASVEEVRAAILKMLDEQSRSEVLSASGERPFDIEGFDSVVMSMCTIVQLAPNKRVALEKMLKLLSEPSRKEFLDDRALENSNEEEPV